MRIQYLADTQFDFPRSDSGWQYQTLDPNNTFGTWGPSLAAENLFAPCATLSCFDADARLGRDFLRPGYSARPSLQWNVPYDGRYIIEVELSMVVASAPGGVCVDVYIDDESIVSNVIYFPYVLKISIVRSIRAHGFVRIVFSGRDSIDANYCLYYSRVRASEQGSEDLAAQSVTVSKTISTAWTTLEETLQKVSGAMFDANDVAFVSKFLFVERSYPNRMHFKTAKSLHAELYPSANRFRESRVFTIKREEDISNDIQITGANIIE